MKLIKQPINESFKKKINKYLTNQSIPRYFLRVRTESLQPEELGLWKMKIGDYFEDHFNFSFRIQAEGKMAENNSP